MMVIGFVFGGVTAKKDDPGYHHVVPIRNIVNIGRLLQREESQVVGKRGKVIA